MADPDIDRNRPPRVPPRDFEGPRRRRQQQQQQPNRRIPSPPKPTERQPARRHQGEDDDKEYANRPARNGDEKTMKTHESSANNRSHQAASNGALKPSQLRVVINRFGLLELDLSDRDLRQMPEAVCMLTRLEVLLLGRNRLRAINPAVSGLRHLRHLDVGSNEIDELPPDLADCTRLVELDARSNRLTSMPARLPTGLSRHLRVLRLGGNRIERLPVDFGRMAALRRVDVSGNRLRELPPSVGDLRELTVLNLADNGFDRLPFDVCRLSNLETLDLGKNQLAELPDGFDRLRRLRELRLAANRFDSLPDVLCKTSGLVVLDISDNAVTSLPVGLSSLPRLVELDARRNAIDRFPEISSSSSSSSSSTAWPCLERLNISGNRLRALPVGSMSRLRRLDADRNWLSDVPHGVHRLAVLEVLCLAGNRIGHLSADVASLKRLRVLDVSDNALMSIPAAVEQMPGLETLDVTGNPLVSPAGQKNKRSGRNNPNNRVAYIVDGVSGSSVTGAVPIVFGRSSSGVVYATPAPAMSLAQGRLNGHRDASAAAKASSTSSSGKSPSGSRLFGLFRTKNRNQRGNVVENGFAASNGENMRKLGLNAGTQTTAFDRMPFPVVPRSYETDSSSAMMMTTTASPFGMAQQTETRPKPISHVDRTPTSSLTMPSGAAFDRHLDYATYRNVLDDTSQPTRQTDHLDSVVGQVSTSSDGRHRKQDTPATDSVGGLSDKLAAWSPMEVRRGSSINVDDGWLSDTVTINDEVGDGLSLGEDDFEFLPPNVHDAKLMRIAGDLETMLSKQLLDPIIDGGVGREVHGRGGRAAGNASIHETVTGQARNMRDSDFSWKPSVRTAFSSDDIGDRRRHLKNGRADVTSQYNLHSTKTSSLPRHLSGATTTVGKSPPDLFVVGIDGGLFRSTTNPDISVYVPTDAVSSTIELQLQVFCIQLEPLLDDANLIAVGDIVLLRDVTAIRIDDVTGPPLRHHVTVTVPVPRVDAAVGLSGRIAPKLHVLTYRDETGDAGEGRLPGTCLPCAYDYSTTRRGLVSIRAWHFTGFGTVLTKTGSAFTGCRSVDQLLRRLANNVESKTVTTAML